MDKSSDQEYVCLGSCQAVITKEQFQNGITTCGNDHCQNKGTPFEEGSRCSICQKNYSNKNKHSH